MKQLHSLGGTVVGLLLSTSPVAAKVEGVSTPRNAGRAQSLMATLESLASETQTRPMRCVYWGDGLRPREAYYRIAVEPRREYHGCYDFMLRLVADDVRGGNESVLVTYLPTVDPLLAEYDDGRTTTLQYQFHGLYDDGIWLSYTDRLLLRDSIDLVFARSSDEGLHRAIRCDDYRVWW